MAAITFERHEAVALVTINRPETMNALDFAESFSTRAFAEKRTPVFRGR
jgi:1,4-dihydroxy-2-naphthoyl-CoA synthase